MDQTATQTNPSAAETTALETATQPTQTDTAQQETILDTTGDNTAAPITDTAATTNVNDLTDTQKDIIKIRQALATLRALGPELVADEMKALESKLYALEEKAKQETEELVQEAQEEIKSLADKFYEKTGMRPWGLVIVTALYIAVKVAGAIFPWLR